MKSDSNILAEQWAYNEIFIISFFLLLLFIEAYAKNREIICFGVW